MLQFLNECSPCGHLLMKYDGLNTDLLEKPRHGFSGRFVVAMNAEHPAHGAHLPWGADPTY